MFRNSVGFSVDFPRDQYMLYLASTEEGTVHKCSFSYNDEVDMYWGHSGPVYKVRCSPFWSNIMLTCSADWTSRRACQSRRSTLRWQSNSNAWPF